MREDEFVHNGLGCELEVIVPDEEHGVFAFFAEMRLAAPCGVASVRCVVDALHSPRYCSLLRRAVCQRSYFLYWSFGISYHCLVVLS